MAKIITKGTSRREVECDAMKIEISFLAKKRQIKDSIGNAVNESNSFLDDLKKAGVDIEKIRAGSNQIDRNDYSDDKNIVTERQITMKTDYDLKLLGVIFKIIEEGSYNVNLNVDSYITNFDLIHNELKTEAAANAREKAELMAEATGMSVVGVERIKMEQYEQYIFDDEEERLSALDGYIHNGTVGDICLAASGGLGSYAELKPETSIEKEDVYIEWLLE